MRGELRKSGVPTFAAIAIALIAFGLFFGNRQGFEGDDLVSIFGISALDAVGRDHVYRYAWQPLAYELLSSLVGLGLKASQLTHVGNVLGMLGVALLAALGSRLLGGSGRATALAVLLILGIPELWITTIYFNTTALALPFFVGSMLVLQATAAQKSALVPGLASGLLFAFACLVRLDFLPAAPFVLALAIRWRQNWATTIVWFVLAVALTLLVLVLARPELPAQMSLILTRYGEGEFRWSLSNSMKVLFLALAPSLVTVPLLLSKSVRATLASATKDRSAWLLVLALLPLLTPLTHLYSGKYLIPFFVCAIVGLCDYFGCAAHAGVTDHMFAPRRQLTAGLVIAAMSIVGLPVLADLKSDPLSTVLRPRAVMHTHDGPRTLGAYFSYAMWHRTPESPGSFMELFRLTAMRLTTCPADTTLVMPKTEWYWGVMLAHLITRDWSIAEYDYPRTVRLSHPSGGAVRFVVREPLPSDGPLAVVGPFDFTNVIVSGIDASVDAAIRRASALSAQACARTADSSLEQSSPP